MKASQKEGLGIYATPYACLPVGRRYALCYLKVAAGWLEKRVQVMALRTNPKAVEGGG